MQHFQQAFKKPLGLQNKTTDTTPSLSSANYENPDFAVKRKFQSSNTKTRKLALFVLMSGLSWAIILYYLFNYTKRSSSSVTAAIYVARQNKQINEALGSNIDTPSIISRISGPVNNVKGFVDVEFDIVGTKGVKARVYLKCGRADRQLNTWDTEHFYVQLKNGDKIELEL
ncbi:hypothetical protein BB561_002401 [Smittium simulii]|uniref:Cytochrome oxidase complex assembly protein 1 n=1 Tax=Smittium simulii TaxID=133385 RepID=A0A2T9YQL8_9FUNG|nr:hypothetical protein BB561_002401 [Smittium simulii]